ncbi:MAG: BNR-4 repeat-containing protein [Kiritimatiellae bacterium]|jgi:hypothetical protein|nr:BNR-4 repeat-containing protein [Kiritimatiellia bacterium]
MKQTALHPFAFHGSEKMIYDSRMGPQAVEHRGKIYIVYQANEHGHPAHPHIIVYDRQSESWSDAVRIGETEHWDHHFCPILWFDQQEHIHVLYHCHNNFGGLHLVSQQACDISKWQTAPKIAPSVSYPRVIPMADNTLLLFYRVSGHLGYWTYRLSKDGGFTWTEANKLIDFDHNPETDKDKWAGSYHSIFPSIDRKSLHMAFVYWDEEKTTNPLYHRKFVSINRHHLYYAKLEIATGTLTTIEGSPVGNAPVNRKEAEKCKVWDTGFQLTNMPYISIDEKDSPSFILPVSEKSPWECGFYYVHRASGEWEKIRIADTNHTWSGSQVLHIGPGQKKAYLTIGHEDGEKYPYGGGVIEEWCFESRNNAWSKTKTLPSEPGMNYNNPQFVYRSTGEIVEDYVLYFGWEGSEGMAPDRTVENLVMTHRGKAFLWKDTPMRRRSGYRADR